VGHLKFTYGVDLDRERFNAEQTTFDAHCPPAAAWSWKGEQGGALPQLPGRWRVAARPAGLAPHRQPDLSGGARRQQMDVDVSDFKNVPGGSNDYQVNLFNLGAIYDFKNGHQVWTNYGEGFDLPDPAKYYGKPGLSVADNPLAGIKSRQVEMGWRYADLDWNAQAALYYTWSDKIINVDARP
jgi:iron complex outermembrane receptor protein